MRRDENAMEHETPTEPDTTPDATNGHGHDGADAPCAVDAGEHLGGGGVQHQRSGA